MGTGADERSAGRALAAAWLRGWVVETALLQGAQLVACGASGSPLVWGLAGVLGVGNAVAFAAVWRLRRDVLDGTHGDVLMENGLRVDSAALRRADRAQRLVAWVWVVAVVGDALGLGPLGTRTGWAVVPLVAVTLLEWGFSHNRRVAAGLLDAHLALRDGRHDDSRRALEGLDGATSAAVRDAVDVGRALLNQRLGDGRAGAEELERTWRGTLDGRGAMVAMARVEHGDPALALQWLAVPRAAPNLHERYLMAALGGLVALHGGDPAGAERAVAPLATTDALPAHYRRQLELVRLAALRQQGRADASDAGLRALEPPLAAEPWRRSVQPRFWRLLTGESAAPTPSSPAPAGGSPTASQPFAPPAEEMAPARRRRRQGAGAIPVEGMVLTAGRRGPLDVVRGVLLLALLAMAPLLLTLAVPLWWFGTPEEQWLSIVSAVVALLGTLVGGLGTLSRWAFRPRGRAPSVTLDDGRCVPLSAWWLFRVQSLLPSLVLAGVIALAALVAEWGSARFWGLGLAVPFELLAAWGALLRYRALDVVRLAHAPDPGRILALAPGRGPTAGAQLRTWRALAHLRAGDAGSAEREAREAAASGAEGAFVLDWLRAGRGEVDLERMVSAPDPEGLGGRYRAAVGLCLAALRAGQASRLTGRVAEFDELVDQLPNVYGDLLARLLVGVRRAVGERVERVPEGTGYVSQVWPFVP